MCNVNHGEWAIECCMPDEAGLEFYLQEYKPFRLNALKQDPQAFGSTYTNEVARVDGDWRRRLYNPIAKTFVAVRPRDRRIFASTSLFGPMPNSEVVSNPNIVSPTTSSSREASAPLLFKLTGVYTCAEARGQGLGQAIVKVAVARAFSEARQRNEECRVEVDVYARNTAAISFYEKCGFRINGPRPDDTDPEDALSELIMYYQP